MKAVRAAGFGKSRNGSWGAGHGWRPARPREASPFGKVLVCAGEWRLTVREAAFSVFIAGAMAFAGFFVAGAIDKSVKDDQLKYRQAPELASDAEFEHAMRTDVGNAFASGKFETLDPVSYDNLPGKHLAVFADYQHYTRHTRVVHYTTGSGKNLRHHTRLEHYWTWDTVRTDSRKASRVRYCGSEFGREKFRYGHVGSGSHTHRIDSDDRIVFTTKPASFSATVFSEFRDSTLKTGTELIPGTTPAKLREELTASHAVGLFWAAWALLTGLVVFGFVYAENEWLEG